MTVLQKFGLFLELVFVLCEIMYFFVETIIFLFVKLGVIIYWPYWPTDYSSIFVPVSFDFCCICLSFVYVCYMEIKFDWFDFDWLIDIKQGLHNKLTKVPRINIL